MAFTGLVGSSQSRAGNMVPGYGATAVMAAVSTAIVSLDGFTDIWFEPLVNTSSFTGRVGEARSRGANIIAGLGASFGGFVARVTETIPEATDFLGQTRFAAFLPKTALPYYAIITQGGPNGAIQASIPILGHPAFHYQINGGYGPIEAPVPPTDVASLIGAGMWAKLYEQGGDGAVVYQGQIQEMPWLYGSTPSLTMHINGMVDDLALSIFNKDYTSTPTDAATVFRAIVGQSNQCTTTSGSVQATTGVLVSYNFQNVSSVDALNVVVNILGPYWYWFCDVTGIVWMVNTAPVNGTPTYRLTQGVDFQQAEVSFSIGNLRNYIVGKGSGSISATYSGAATQALFGKRALNPPLSYPQLTSSGQLTTIVNNVGAALDRVIRKATITLNNYGSRFALGGGVIPRTQLTFPAGPINSDQYQPAFPEWIGINQKTLTPGQSIPMFEFFNGTTYSTTTPPNNMIVMDVIIDGPQQTVIVGDVPVTIDDLNYQIESNLNRIIAKTA